MFRAFAQRRFSSFLDQNPRSRRVLFATAATATGSLALFAGFSFLQSTDAYKQLRSAFIVQGSSTGSKEKLVILGSGWAATALLKKLESDHYDITVVSPNNYFLFTPLLPSAIAGTVESRSLMESIRKICLSTKANYVEGKAEDINIKDKILVVRSNEGDAFEIPYSKLVIGVGAETNTFGIRGVKEHTYFLKTVADAIGIRNKVIDNFEKANLPSTSPDERKRLLSFVVVGGGPTGVEAAAELSDLFQEDMQRLYPNIKPDEVNIILLEGLDRILNTYDRKISEYTEKLFKRQNIDVRKKAMVTEVRDSSITYKNLLNNEVIDIPYGLTIWSTGIGMNPFIKKFKDQIPCQQNSRVLLTDSHLRVKGVDDGSIYALGDCASIEIPQILKSSTQLFEKADTNGDKKLSFQEFDDLVEDVEKKSPIVGSHFRYVKEVFHRYDLDKDGTLSLEEFQGLLSDVNKKLRTLPATAQVASQQGTYLGQKLLDLAESGASQSDLPPFRYRHFGSLVYLGEDQAAIDLGDNWSVEGYGAYWLWRSIYWSEQISLRTRFVVAMDWVRKLLFGRDVSKSQ